MTRIRRDGFTLIELLTVIAIITLLIGILTPALGRARDEARKTAVKAALQSISTGCEMFRNDVDRYPYSNAAEYGILDPTRIWEVGDPTTPLQGANLILDALVGRDFNGYDPKPTTHMPPYNRWFADNTRRRPYIDPAAIDSSNLQKSVEDAFGPFGPDPADNLATPMIAGMTCPVFKDKFGWPILYYRANPRQTTRMRILPAGWDAGTNMPDPDAAVYNGRDNAVFTGHGAGSRMHDIQEAEDPLTGTPDTDIGHSFANFIRSFRASTRSPAAPEQWEFLRPVNPDTFILLTPGRDGIYGNLDDVGNFAVKSEER